MLKYLLAKLDGQVSQIDIPCSSHLSTYFVVTNSTSSEEY